MKYDVCTIQNLIKQSNQKELLLPNFQRDFVWDKENQQKGLVASLMYDIPIGSLLILRGKKDYFASKELGHKDQATNIKEEIVSYLLDGQQRISTIKSIFHDFFSEQDWKEKLPYIYNRLHTRWFVQAKPTEGQIDLFGWDNLNFKGQETIQMFEPDQISDAILCKLINKNQTDNWYHPDYKKEKWCEQGNIYTSIKQKILSERMAEEGVIPLYSILAEVKSEALHHKVITKIAVDRIEQLKAEVEDGKRSIREIIQLSENMYSNEEDLEIAWIDLKDNWVDNVSQFLENLKTKEIPYILLEKDEINKAIHTFERVNKGGTALSTYDLIVAKVAQVNNTQTLTDRIEQQISQSIEIPKSLTKNIKSIQATYRWTATVMELIDKDGLNKKIKEQYLNLLSILSYVEYGIPDKITLDHIKKTKHLELTPHKINDNTQSTVKALIRAYAFLQFRCGIIKHEDLNYSLMIMPIAYTLLDDTNWNNEHVLDKIEYWYWCSLFGGAYKDTPNQRCIEDIKNLTEFIKGGNNVFLARHKKVLKVEDYSNFEALTFKGENLTKIGAVEKGILQYVLSKEPKDFLEEELCLRVWEVAQEKTCIICGKENIIKLEDHHICPLGTATKIGQSSKTIREKKKSHVLNSVLNRTYISSIANRLISDKKIDDYFQYVSQISRYGHCIPKEFKKYDTSEINLDEEKYYESLVKARYDDILEDLLVELEALK